VQNVLQHFNVLNGTPQDLNFRKSLFRVATGSLLELLKGFVYLRTEARKKEEGS
jgi:hypothetical protein